MRMGLTSALTALVFFYAAGASAQEMQTQSDPSAATQTTAAPETNDKPAEAGVERPATSAEPAWTFAFTPYVWAARTQARIRTPQGETIRANQSFRDSLDDLKFAALGTWEAKRDRLVIVSDLIYLKLGAAASGRLGPIPFKSNVDLKLLTSTTMLGYRAFEKGAMFFDVLAGLRITREKLDIGLSGPNRSVERDFGETNAGPVLASRFRAALGGRWGLGLYGDIGGFGLSSDFSWQLMGNVHYNLSRHWRLAAGWRHYSVHDKRRDFDVHLAFDGPVLGATYLF